LVIASSCMRKIGWIHTSKFNADCFIFSLKVTNSRLLLYSAVSSHKIILTHENSRLYCGDTTTADESRCVSCLYCSTDDNSRGWLEVSRVRDSLWSPWWRQCKFECKFEHGARRHWRRGGEISSARGSCPVYHRTHDSWSIITPNCYRRLVRMFRVHAVWRMGKAWWYRRTCWHKNILQTLHPDVRRLAERGARYFPTEVGYFAWSWRSKMLVPIEAVSSTNPGHSATGQNATDKSQRTKWHREDWPPKKMPWRKNNPGQNATVLFLSRLKCWYGRE